MSQGRYKSMFEYVTSELYYGMFSCVRQGIMLYMALRIGTVCLSAVCQVRCMAGLHPCMSCFRHRYELEILQPDSKDELIFYSEIIAVSSKSLPSYIYLNFC